MSENYDHPPIGRATSAGVIEYTDVIVARFVGYRPLECDLRVPPGRGPWPVVIWVHGGAWRTGTRHDHRGAFGLHERLLARGYAVADVDYRLSAETVYPGQLLDIQAAIRWVRRFASQLCVDPNRFAVFGDSAGGHLAVLAALAVTPADGSAAVHAVVDWYGPTDLTFPDGPPTADDPAIALLGGPPADVPELARLGSPVYQAHPQAPPLLCVHGTDDQNVPFAASQALVAAWQSHGAHAELIAVPGAKHCFKGCTDINTLVEQSIDFLDRTLYKPSVPPEQVTCTDLDGTSIAVSGTSDRMVRMWDLRTRQQIGKPLTGHTGGVSAVACTILGDIPTAVSSSWDGTLRKWDLRARQQIGQPIAGHTGPVEAVACTVVDSTSVAVSGSLDRTVRMWDLGTGRQIGQPLAGHTGGIKAVACTTLGNTPIAVTGSEDRTVRVWDLRIRRQIGQPLAGHTDGINAVACAVVNDTPIAVSGSGDRTVRIWDLGTGRQIGQPLVGHTGPVEAVACAVLDSAPVAVTGSGDRTVRIWDLRNGRQIGKPLAGHADGVSAVACAVVNDTPIAVSGSLDRTLQVWDLHAHTTD
ncbi:alpha/beta hydrolase fold domain-containing protein [Actinocrinis puniceicyclus]|uniref:Alpha/beta hydrolase fold domain-containing protein n=1 Tax=Actinocrinis puniceicyclus TaxID=977794 RepID=A0A8J7WST5_9ACTN|nr:alpha/beta hydrolase fold domain-containing protein [Actinocrinis puniceicyclus]MBS2965832.1 alpha/beta hydrolase fold domain-containing protein [Actinocrinis puniceicyclus]